MRRRRDWEEGRDKCVYRYRRVRSSVWRLVHCIKIGLEELDAYNFIRTKI